MIFAQFKLILKHFDPVLAYFVECWGFWEQDCRSREFWDFGIGWLRGFGDLIDYICKYLLYLITFVVDQDASDGNLFAWYNFGLLDQGFVVETTQKALNAVA